jgi:hypothetical protein
VIIDDAAGVTGSAVLQGFWAGRQFGGLPFMTARNNAIHIMNPYWGLSHMDAHVGRTYEANTLWGKGGMFLAGDTANPALGWSGGVLKDNIVPWVSGRRGVAMIDNYVGWQGGGSFDARKAAIWEDPTTIYGLAYKAGGPGDKGPAAGKGALALIQEINAQNGPPAAPDKHEWKASSTKAGEIQIQIVTAPHGSDTRNVSFEAELDGSGEWIKLSAINKWPITKRHVMKKVKAGNHTIRLRCRVTKPSRVVGATSESKMVHVK